MKKYLESRYVIVLLACGGLTALFLLSATLRDFSFQPSQPFSINLFGSGPALGGGDAGLEIPLWKFILFGVLLVTLFVVLMILMDAEARKRVLLKTFRFLMTMVALWMIMNYAYERGSLQQLMNLIPTEGGAAASATQTVMPEYIAPQISPWVVLAVSFGVGLVLVLLGWFFYTLRPKARGSYAMDEIAGIAREALKNLEPGHDWDEAIVRAYIRMSEVVTAERGLIRQPATTPSEYARRMERSGLPNEAVNTLTRLFEGVRYGGNRSSLAERDQAAAALSAILHACGVNL